MNTVLQDLQILLVMGYMDLKSKYKGSFFGYFWSFLKPLMQFFIYFFAFSFILKISADPNYPLMLFLGILIWAWFAESTGLGLQCFLGRRSIVTKINVNKLLPPLAAYLTPTINFLFNICVFLLAYMVFGKTYPEHILSLGHIMMLVCSLLQLSLIIIACNVILGNLNVLYRDVQTIWELLLNYGIFLTPIIYPIHINSPTQALIYYSLNMLAFPLENLRAVFFTGTVYHFYDVKIALCSLFSLVLLLVFSFFIHRSLNKKIMDYL